VFRRAGNELHMVVERGEKIVPRYDLRGRVERTIRILDKGDTKGSGTVRGTD
jgi:hypothetical protein